MTGARFRCPPARSQRAAQRIRHILRKQESKPHFSFGKSTRCLRSQHRFEEGAIVLGIRTDHRGNAGTLICRGKKCVQDASPTKRVFRHPVVKDGHCRIFGPNLTHLSRIPPRPSLLKSVYHSSWRLESARIGDYVKIFRYNLRRQCKIVSIVDESVSQYDSRVVIRVIRDTELHEKGRIKPEGHPASLQGCPARVLPRAASLPGIRA